MEVLFFSMNSDYVVGRLKVPLCHRYNFTIARNVFAINFFEMSRQSVWWCNC